MVKKIIRTKAARGVVVKIAKTGLTEALKIVTLARKNKLHTMISCMAQSARVSIVNCARAGVADLAADLAPAVETILTGDTPSWRDQLDAILTVGKDAGACAVQSVGLDLARRAAQLVGIHAEGQEATGAANARAYLESRHVVFEVAQ
jgi:L-alanine-DL-glutamate epimerase-like enolase superfamily enzyme